MHVALHPNLQLLALPVLHCATCQAQRTAGKSDLGTRSVVSDSGTLMRHTPRARSHRDSMGGRLGGASARRAGSLPASARTIAQRQRVSRALPPTLICLSCVFDQTHDHTPKLSRAAHLPWPRAQQDGGLRPGTQLFKQRQDRLGTPIHSSEQVASAGPGCGRAPPPGPRLTQSTRPARDCGRRRARLAPRPLVQKLRQQLRRE